MSSTLKPGENHCDTDAFQESTAVQAQASALGFDWPDVEGVLAKVDEEIAEIRAALRTGDLEHARRELGDLLLATVNLARFLKADPAATLRSATLRFSCRFEALKKELREQGKSVGDCSLNELDEVWNRVKTHASQ